MKAVLVVGATGQQGSSVVRALSQSGRYFSLALTRNPSSPRAERIASWENVKLVSADLGNISQLQTVFVEAKQSPIGPIWGVFVALAFPGLGVDATKEEAQGKAVASMAAEFDVQCYIYSSVIMCASDEWHSPSPESDRGAKTSIEKHVKNLGISWTIIRPGFFMENFSPGILGRITDGIVRYSGARVQLIVDDIGPVSCAIFDDPPKFKNKTVDVAGDSLSSQARSEAFVRATGYDIPGVPNFLVSAIYRYNANIQEIVKELRLVDEARMQDPNGYDANFREVADHVKLTNFDEWTQRRHRDTEGTMNANGVTLWGLITRRY